MSDATLSDIDFTNKLARVWTTLNSFLPMAVSKTAVRVKKLIKLDGSSLKSLFRPPRPTGSTKLRVPTPLMQINIDNIIAKISRYEFSRYVSYFMSHVYDELTSNIKDLIIWINSSLFLKIACNETSISSNNSKRESSYISDEFHQS